MNADKIFRGARDFFSLLEKELEPLGIDVRYEATEVLQHDDGSLQLQVRVGWDAPAPVPPKGPFKDADAEVAAVSAAQKTALEKRAVAIAKIEAVGFARGSEWRDASERSAAQAHHEIRSASGDLLNLRERLRR